MSGSFLSARSSRSAPDSDYVLRYDSDIIAVIEDPDELIPVSIPIASTYMFLRSALRETCARSQCQSVSNSPNLIELADVLDPFVGSSGFLRRLLCIMESPPSVGPTPDKCNAGFLTGNLVVYLIPIGLKVRRTPFK